VPIHIAFGLSENDAAELDDVDRTVLAIFFRIFEGAKFDMQNMCFQEDG